MFRLPLTGTRILDLTMSWAGPFATRLLGDMGAEVIKIEAVKSWDLLRSFTGQPPDTERVWDKSPYFNHNNRNKYGCVLDLSHPRGRDLFLRLVPTADAVVENFSPGVMERLGLGYEVLSAVNPGLILVSMPAMGSTGPEKDFIAYGTNVEQLSGLCHLTGYQDGPPHKTGISYGDPMAGIAAAGALALALWQRRRTGRGQRIEVAQRENLINVIGEFILAYAITGEEPQRRGNRHSSMAPHGCYPCAGDDQWLAIACEDDAQFAALCSAIGQPGLADDQRFADVASRYRHQHVLDGIISAWTRPQEKGSAAAILQAAGVPAAPVQTVPEVFQDEHLRARGFFEPVSHAVAGCWEMEAPHWRMSETPAHIRLPPPSFGEHNHWVFRHLLGLSDEEVEGLRAEGVTGDAPDWSVHQ